MTTELLPAIAAAAAAVLALPMLLAAAHRLRPRAVRARVQPRPVNRSIDR